MIKRVVLALVFLTVFIVGAVSIACLPREEIRSEAFSSLEQMSKAGIVSIDKEIAAIDQKLRDIETRMVKLEQVMAPALKWVENKTATIDYDQIPCG